MTFQTFLAILSLLLAIAAFTLVFRTSGNLLSDREGNRFGMVLAGILSLAMMYLLIVPNLEFSPHLEKPVAIISTLALVALGSGIFILQYRWKQILRSKVS